MSHHSPEEPLRVAVADGASTTLFSGLWAELLVSAFIAEPEGKAKLPPLDSLRRQWYDTVTRTELPWHQQVQLAKGAAAAFVGIVVANSGEWSAVAVGDCSLFQIRDNQCIVSFPVENENDLASLPLLLQTHPPSPTQKEKDVFSIEGQMLPGDSLFLMTDALASWFLQERGNQRAPWLWLQDISHLSVFKSRIQGLRVAQRLKEDDISFAHITRTV